MGQQVPSHNVVLYGTEETDEPGRLLRAGPPTVEFHNGQIRYVRMGGQEMLRAIAFLVRDESWGTYDAAISGLEIEERPGEFRVRYQGSCADGAVEYVAEITGSERGLSFATQTANRLFHTNRLGFAILHPLEGCAGRPVEVERVDGRVEPSAFPSRIDAYQPFFQVRALKHEFAPGAFVTVRLEGETFEMEDQRNWSDASFKTYPRPIGLPWPFEIAAGTRLAQTVSLTIEGSPPAEARAAAEGEVEVTLGAPVGTMPRIGIEIPALEAAASRERLALVQALGPQLIVGEGANRNCP